MKRASCTLTICCIILAASACRADIYRHDGDDDVVSFTDSPRNKGFQLVQKEQRSRPVHRSGAKLTGQPDLPKAGAVNQTGEHGDNARILPIQGRITSPAGMRNDPFDGKLKHHNGLDIAAPTGTPVKPVAPGTVIYSGWRKGYGNTVILDHGGGMVTVYAHHASNSVYEGDTVDTGSVIALTGSTGRATGPHLHFEAWRSGINITSEFMPGNAVNQQPSTVATAPIKRYLQVDGTIVFSNMR